MITCTHCGVSKDRRLFNAYKRKLNGKNSWCQKCCRQKNRAWEKKQTQLVRDYKINAGCTDCGYKHHAAALQFDHLRDKLFTIGDSTKRCGGKKLLDEIKKCEVVCANCHSIRSHRRRTGLEVK